MLHGQVTGLLAEATITSVYALLFHHSLTIILNAMGTEVPTASLKKTTQKYSRQKENIPQFVGNLFQT